MSQVHYDIVEHDGGWAYRLGDVFSETYATRQEAHEAAERAAREQQVGGDTREIEYQDREGVWHQETARGGDRPEADVEP